MPFWLALLLLPISAAGIIFSAARIKKKPVKILGITLFSIIFALMFAYTVLVFILVFREDDAYDDPEQASDSYISEFVAVTDDMTDNGDCTYTYDDGEISLTFERISADDMEAALEEASSDISDEAVSLSESSSVNGKVLHGESGGHKWSAVTDREGRPVTVYISAGDATVSAKVNSAPENVGAEYAASAAAALVKDKKPYSDSKKDSRYRTDSASFYIEEADCLLYYPAQLTKFSHKGGAYIFRDEKSSAVLKVTLSPNEYTSMSGVEGFIKNLENNLVLAYGPNWFTSESSKGKKVTFGYSGFGSKYIVEAELTYPKKNREVFDDLRGLIKCCFVGDGIWKSKAAAEGYSQDNSTSYSDKFSREMAAYYSEEYCAVLIYPEIFSQADKTDEYVLFTDPVTGAQMIFYSDPECIPLNEWPQYNGFDESYIDGEHSVRVSMMSGGAYGVMYLTDNANICALLAYPEEYAWVYDEFEDKLTIMTSGDEISSTEMQTVFIEEYGALITMPLQFTETSFYDGVIRYTDGLNGMEMTVSFEYLTSDNERKNIFACFDVTADDEDIYIGDSYVRWLSNDGFFYGARGSEMKALMQIDAPNAEMAYKSTLPMFAVEFVTEDSREETKAQEIAQMLAEEMSDPPEETEAETEVTDEYPTAAETFHTTAETYALTEAGPTVSETSAVTHQTKPTASQTAAATTQPNSQTSSQSKLDEYRIVEGDTSHDSEYGYDIEMAETIDMILDDYDEDDITAYITALYADEKVIDITDNMYTGGYDHSYGYTTTLVYILYRYPDDAVISAMIHGLPLPAREAYIYFPTYDDYGTDWGEPYSSVWVIADEGTLDEFDLLVNTELCGYIYDIYGDVILSITEVITDDSYYYDKVPFWINGWESSPERAAYCRDFVIPAAAGVIGEYCDSSDEFAMDCLCADASAVSFSADGRNHTGLKITALDQIYDGYDPTFDAMEFYLDIQTGALYMISSDGTAEIISSNIFS